MLNMFAVVLILSSLLGISLSEAQNCKRLVIPWNVDVGPINAHAYNPNQFFAQNWLYDGLVSYGINGGIIPSLATSWTVSVDGVKFSDGTEFNATVAKLNFDQVFAAQAQTGDHGWLDLINQIDVYSIVDRYTFVIVLKNAYYPALQELTLTRPVRFMSLNSFPDNNITYWGIKKPIGTGPWQLESREQGKYAVFTKNPYYWGEAPAIDMITVKVIPDSQDIINSFKNGSVDMIFGSGIIGYEDFVNIRNTGLYQTYISEAIQTRLIVLNSNVTRNTGEIEVRQAIQHAVNKTDIVQRVLFGVEQVSERLFATNVPYANVPLPSIPYSTDTAIEILEDAGWTLQNGAMWRTKNGNTLTLQVSFIANNEIDEDIALFLQQQLTPLGIQLQLLGETKAAHYQRAITGNFDISFTRTWGPPYDPHSYISMMRVPNEPDYHAQLGLANKAMIDDSITDILLESDEIQRQTKYRILLNDLANTRVYLPLSYAVNVAVVQNNVTGFQFGQQEYQLDAHLVDSLHIHSSCVSSSASFNSVPIGLVGFFIAFMFLIK